MNLLLHLAELKPGAPKAQVAGAILIGTLYCVGWFAGGLFAYMILKEPLTTGTLIGAVVFSLPGFVIGWIGLRLVWAGLRALR